VRGTTNALVDASINLYRVKHAKLDKDNFANHTFGYTGAGKGGAERLRALDEVSDVFGLYQTDLGDVYKTHASKKAKRPWEAGLAKNASDEDKQAAWMAHKFRKWTARE
jgi:hypothetical protein